MVLDKAAGRGPLLTDILIGCIICFSISLLCRKHQHRIVWYHLLLCLDSALSHVCRGVPGHKYTRRRQVIGSIIHCLCFCYHPIRLGPSVREYKVLLFYRLHCLGRDGAHSHLPVLARDQGPDTGGMDEAFQA